MAENLSFVCRALAPVKRALVAPVTLLFLASMVIVFAPSSGESREADAVSASPSLVCAASTCTWTFPYTGDYYEWTVPAGVSQVGFDVYGAQGGDGGPSAGGLGSIKAGGLGGRVQGKLTVTPSSVLRIYVGGKGTNYSLSGAGGYNGGGSTSATSDDNRRPGAGGGASDIRTSSTLQSRVVVAGGGGGASGWKEAVGGAGGGLTGQDAPGPYWCGSGGKGGTQSAGGAAGACGNQAGSLGVGGNGKGNSHGGGGGGGGYYGGGGGTIDGGGGGSSYTSPTLATEVVHTQGSRTGNGLVVLTMLRPGVSSFAATVSSPSNQSSSLTYNLQFSENVSGLDQSEITLSGTSTGWSISSFSGSGASYTVGLTGTNVTTGSVILTVAQDAVTSDVTGQTGPGTATASTTLNIDVDPPGASVSSAPSSPAAAMSLTFGLAFTESVSGIAAGDFSNAGTALGCVFTPSAASGSSVNVVVTQCQEGTLQLKLASNSVVDAAGNTGPTSDMTSSVITLAASALSVTAGAKTANFGGSWTDSYTQTGLLGSDTITVSYTYSGTTNAGVAYGPSATKPTEAGTYSIIPGVSYGGANANRYALTVTNGSLTINRVSQAALTVSTTSATYGSTLSLGTTGGSGTGTVTWQVVSGTCTVAGSTLTPGDAGSACVVRATKAQDGNYLVVSSADTTVTVGRASQATLFVSTTSVTYGDQLILGTSGGSGGGAVTWSVVSGTCTIVGALLTPGNAGSACVIKATKAQDGNYLVVSSADTTVTINRASQAALTVSSTSATYGQSLSLTTSGGSGTGAVTWQVVSGTCTVAGSTLTVGNAGSVCVVKATKAQDTNYLVVNSADTTVTVGRASQAVLSVSTTQTAYGQDLVLGTSGGSGTGAVTWQVVSGTCTIVGALLTPGDAGSACVIKATKAQDTNYLVASSSNTTVTINKASQNGFAISSASVFTTGQSLSLTASGGQSGGAVTWQVTAGVCSLSGSTLTATRGGITCTVEATRAASGNYFAATDTMVITVDKIIQVLTFQSTPPSSTLVGGTYTVTVTSDASLAPTVTVANASSQVCSISAGVVTFTAVGTCTINATQAGNDVYAGASASQQITVTPVPTTTTSTVAPVNGSSGGTSPTTSVAPMPPASSSTSTTSTTTTTTTTTIPSDDPSVVEMEAGEATALVQGKRVKVTVETVNGQIVMRLPNNVTVRFGPPPGSASGAAINADGELAAYTNDTIQMQAEGFDAGSTYVVTMYSDPVELGRGEVASNGGVSKVVTVPKDAKAGDHTMVIEGVGTNSEVVTVSMGFKVLDRSSNTVPAVIAISLAILLALLGGRPILRRRRVNSATR